MAEMSQLDDGMPSTEDDIMLHLENDLSNGKSIDSIIGYPGLDRLLHDGTLLHRAVEEGRMPVVQYALSKGANVAIERIGHDVHGLKYRNAFDLSVEQFNIFTLVCPFEYCVAYRYYVLDKLKNRSLELFASYGLTPLHLDCAIRMQHWDDEAISRLQSADVNDAVSAESPFWPKMRPILIAAKFGYEDLVKILLDLGANPIVRDHRGNTPLHYLHNNTSFYDDRLFATDGNSSYSSFSGRTHFYFACKQYPVSLVHVKRYLEQGISPDLSLKTSLYDSLLPRSGSRAGLYCSKLTALLLEYGAEVEKKDSYGQTPIESYLNLLILDLEIVKCFCLLIEVGSNIERVDTKKFLRNILRVEHKVIFLACIVRLKTLNVNLVQEKLNNVYNEFKNQVGDRWNEAEYTDRCSVELDAISELGLRHILAHDEANVKSDFEANCGWLDDFDFDSYPIYGEMLRIKAKRKLLKFKEKRRKIWKAAPRVRQLFQNVCHLPDLCVKAILWHFSIGELDRFLAQSSNEFSDQFFKMINCRITGNLKKASERVQLSRLKTPSFLAHF